MNAARTGLGVTLFAAAIALVALAGGCAAPWNANPWNAAVETPDRFAIKRGQLQIYSDAELPEDHRLFDDMMSLRDDVLFAVGLPGSDESIHVYLFDSADGFSDFIEANFPSFPKRRAFFVENDRRLSVYAHWGDRVAEDLRHEVTHGYIHSVVPRIPLWLDEGLAEYFETPRGEGGFNSPHVEDLGWKFQGGWRPDLARLESLNSAANMTQLDYAESWAWTHLLLRGDRRTREALQGYLRDVAEQGAAEPLSARLRRVMPDPEATLIKHLESLFEASKLARNGASAEVR